MNALSIPQTSNITHLHTRMCVHCGQKPVYAPKAIYCGTSCTNKAYRARKRENRTIITLEHRMEQLLSVIEQQSAQIAALTSTLQQQPSAGTSAPSFHGNLKPAAAAAPVRDLLEIKQAAPDKNSSKNLLNQLQQISQQ